jgi:hypothetical protein
MSRLSWNEIRVRAAAFASDWADATYERGQTQTFYNEFFEVFGIPRKRVASFEEPVRKLGDKRGFIDLFWKGKLLVEHKSAGRNLITARDQAFAYLPGITDADLPRYILVSDFQLFELLDVETNEEVRFPLRDLPRHVQKFGFMIGQERRVFRDQDPVNILAAEQMGRLHDALKASGYGGHDLEQFLVRVLFCLFGDDTGIFQPLNIFEALIRERTKADGSDLGMWLAQLFQVLNTPEERRQITLDEDLAAFPYVNGALFAETLPIPAFDAKMRATLLQACAFNWEAISPAIFGSLFQSVMQPAERRKKGAHYTTEKNILKLIGPLFMDDLRAEFARIVALKRGKEAALRAFHDKLASLTFFDPACGCGNFLVITYREMRALEIEVLRALRGDAGNLELDAAALSRLDVNQFHGIEIDEFPARIAEVAMWMMDHIMNNRLSLEFGQVYARIPLKASPNIVHGDALALDWAEMLPPARCNHILGNPPFIGAKMQSENQRAQVRAIAGLGGSGGTLDFVAAWFLKAGAYVAGNPAARIAFVATNSITQGEQVGQLWPILFHRHKLEIAFAHRTFAWGSDARGKAHVHCVIVGLTRREFEPEIKRLFSYETVNAEPLESGHAALSPYLFDASRLSDRHLVVKEEGRPLGEAPKVVIGSKPIDGGHYIFDRAAAEAFLVKQPEAIGLLRPYVGAEEYINGGDRSILVLHDVGPDRLRALPHVAARVAAVRQLRQQSSSAPTRALADTPTRYHVTVIPTAPFLCVPKVSSERRDYVPIGWLEPPVVPSDLVFVIQNAEHTHFATLTSAMHMAWLRNIGGRLKSDFRYSIGLVYNPFPWPDLTDADRSRLETLAQAILDARAAHPGATLADLYDPDLMPPDLRRAHKALDLAVDRLYRKEPFAGDRERVEHLFMLYEKMTAGLLATPAKKGRRGRRIMA